MQTLLQILALLLLPVCFSIQTITTTVTQLQVQTVTESIVAIGGVIQNVKVYLDNGNGNTWDYSTRLVTGERVFTITTITDSDCATVYVYGDVTLTTESTYLPGKAALSKPTVLEDLSKWKQLHAKDVDAKQLMDSFVRNAAHLNHIDPDSKNGNVVLSV